MASPPVVLIHKVPASWESTSRTKEGIIEVSKKKQKRLGRLNEQESIFLNGLKDDIFVRFADSISKYLHLDEMNIILGHDEREQRNWGAITREGHVNLDGKFDFYSVKSPNRFPKIENNPILVLRGNYPNFHNQLISTFRPSLTIFYPATSMLFPHLGQRLTELKKGIIAGNTTDTDIDYYIKMLSSNSVFSKIRIPEKNTEKTDLNYRQDVGKFLDSCLKISKNMRERISPGKYDVVLYDEEKNYDDISKKYPNSQLMKFNKPPSPIFKFDITRDRKYDLIFSGTTLQKTKNHDTFYSIVDSLISKKRDLRIAIVGVKSNREKLQSKWGNFNVDVFGEVGKEELSRLFNISRFHIITSSRDCYPRTIPESLICGCHILALDLLSDGLTMIEENPILGTVIRTKGEIFSIESSYSLSINPTDHTVDQILSQINVQRDHLLISSLASELFPLENMVQMDLIWQSADLSLNFL